jgi:hypothetical protein
MRCCVFNQKTRDACCTWMLRFVPLAGAASGTRSDCEKDFRFLPRWQRIAIGIVTLRLKQYLRWFGEARQRAE